MAHLLNDNDDDDDDDDDGDDGDDDGDHLLSDNGILRLRGISVLLCPIVVHLRKKHSSKIL